MTIADEQAIWHRAHEIAAREMASIEAGVCKRPGLAAALANFAIECAKAEREACAKVADGFKSHADWNVETAECIASSIRGRSDQ